MMLKPYLWLIYADMIVQVRQAYAWLTPLIFFVMVICLFPLSMGHDEMILKKVAPGIIWVAALLSIVTSIHRLFSTDAETGHLELLLQSPHSLTGLVLCKLLAYWLLYCMPLLFLSPLIALMLHLPWHTIGSLQLTLLLGTPVLCLIGAIGAALVIGIRHAGLLLPILIMPLYIPVLIFGSNALISAEAGLPVNAYYALLAALIFITLVFAPFFTGLALRIGVNQSC